MGYEMGKLKAIESPPKKNSKMISSCQSAIHHVWSVSESVDREDMWGYGCVSCGYASVWLSRSVVLMFW